MDARFARENNSSRKHGPDGILRRESPPNKRPTTNSTATPMSMGAGSTVTHEPRAKMMPAATANQGSLALVARLAALACPQNNGVVNVARFVLVISVD